MKDLMLNAGDFHTTEIVISGMSESGKKFITDQFGFATVSVNIPKSKGGEFEAFAKQHGMSCQWKL